MNLYEYEGKKLFSRYGIAVPRSVLWRNGSEPRRQWMKNPVVLKAQVLAGERKKAGGILFASGAADAARRYRAQIRKNKAR
ncbi:MAG: ATP-grasp domain-containing protein, partial [Patescibacteria group bacterium]